MNVGIFQIWKKGQVFGYARGLGDDLEWHVRAFVDGSLESELELPRTTIQHLLQTPFQHDGLLEHLLRRYRIPFSRMFPQAPRTAHTSYRFRWPTETLT